MVHRSELESLRREISSITFEILHLCKKRLDVAKRIAMVKLRASLPIEDSRIEENLRRRVIIFCREKSLHEDFCNALLELLIKESKRVQKEVMEHACTQMEAN
ncbi:chorismate mutase [Candidatus Bathyarchaeota archaeon]|nr:chorismate mutase [Candidatus Bathyarchaeota archaeon]